MKKITILWVDDEIELLVPHMKLLESRGLQVEGVANGEDAISLVAEPGRRFDLEFEGAYRNYDYPNAFAFHEPVAGPKTLETLDAEILATWRISRHFRLVAEIDFRETASTDTRIQYERTRYSLSVVWEL